MTNPFDLTGRTALVTGSSRGLGRAMAEGLAAAGAAIVLNGSDADRLSAAAADLRAVGYRVFEERFDVTDEAGVVAAFERLDAEGVAIRTGHHCCQPLMHRLGVPATNRASFYLYSVPEEVDRLADGVRQAKQLLG